MSSGWPAVRDITHGLIGIYANLRIPSLREPVYKIRQLIDGGDQARLEPMLDQLRGEFSDRFEKLKKILS